MSSALRTKLSATMSTPSCAPNLQVLDVLRRQRVGRKLHAGRVDALVLFEHSAFDDSRDNFAPVGSLDLELNLAVVEQQLPARASLAHKLAVRRVDVLVVAIAVAGDDANRLPVLQLDRAPALEPPGPDFRAAQILKYRHDLRRAGCSRANPPERFGVRLVRSVGKIEPAYVDAGVDELLDDVVAATCRTYGGDDLCVPHVRRQLTSQAAATYNPAMDESVRGRGKRVLVVGATDGEHGVAAMPHWRLMAC